MNLSPIAFFCFNRADKTKAVLDALAQNELAQDSELFIFCDGPRNIRDLEAIKKVHEVIDNFSGFKKIHITKREINHGSQFSIIYGINYVLENHDSVIVVEDDIITAKPFLKFLNSALQFYKDEENIWCVTGFNYPKNLLKFPPNYHEDIFFVCGKNSSWGWATWKNRWQKVDFEVKDFASFIKNKELVKAFNRAAGNMTEMLRLQMEKKINAWDIQMAYAMFKNSGYTMHPIKTMVKNIGFDASGTHTVSDMDLTNFEFENSEEFKLKKLAEIPQNYLAENAYIGFHKDQFFLKKWFTSKKKRRNLKWFLAGVLFATLVNFIF